MKFKTQIPVIAMIFVTAICVAAFSARKPQNGNASAPGFAVIELFTSEGCSSCPPADALVARIQKESAGKPVYILAYHVDYWNRLGWRDPFSAAAYSQRQNKYAAWINSSSVYTPHIVVNGRKQFVGYEEGTLRNALKAAAQSKQRGQLSIDDIVIKGDKVNYSFKADDIGGSTALVVALVQKAATTVVKAGENSGHTLPHVQIVRSFQNVPVTKNVGMGRIDMPKGINENDVELIAFLQNQQNGQITAACSRELNAVKAAM